MNLEHINANLLVALEALLIECSVTRAAQRLGLTQPATSNALARLRDLFDDPILVRVGRGMEPTALGRRLFDPVREGTSAFREALAVTQSFDPREAKLSVRIAANDFGQAILLPAMFKRLAIEAPHIRISLAHARHYEDKRGLDDGAADLFLGFIGNTAAGYFSQPLFEEHLLVIARTGHPIVGKRLTLRRYLALDHVVVGNEPDSPGAVDVALAQHDLQRNVVLHVPHFLQVPLLVAQTDLVAATNSRLARYFAPRLDLSVHKLPIDVSSATVGLIWHARTHGDPGHAWFRAWVTRLVGPSAQNGTI